MGGGEPGLSEPSSMPSCAVASHLERGADPAIFAQEWDVLLIKGLR